MRVALYAPLKPLDHPVPSGDRRTLRGLIAALALAGHSTLPASRLRSYDGRGDARRQARIATIGARMRARLARRHEDCPAPPDAWITYHAYHKSPDWLGPELAAARRIPYLLVEASFATKQARGPWAAGHARMAATLAAADVVLAMTAHDMPGLAAAIRPPTKLERLAPFLDTAPYAEAGRSRADHRAAWAARLDLDPARPWLLTVAMMRPGVKRDSYALLADAIRRLPAELPWQLIAVGDGPVRGEITDMLGALGHESVRLPGRLDETELAGLYAASDLFLWPAIGEAYGMVFLEAQAAGLPVVAGATGGVGEVVRDRDGGRLVTSNDSGAFAHAAAELLAAPAERAAEGERAARRIEAEHGLAHAARCLDTALREAVAIRAGR